MGINSCIIEENGVCFVTIGTVAKIVERSVQTVRLWDNWSDELASEGKDRLIPKSRRFGKNNSRCWSLADVALIETFSKNLKYGDIAQFSRTRWGEKADKLKYDRSTEARQQTHEYRKKVNAEGKRIQKKKLVEEIKKEKGNLIKAVRSTAKKIYEDVKYKEN